MPFKENKINDEDITEEILSSTFTKWLEKKCSEYIFNKIDKTLQHLHDNNLNITLITNKHKNNTAYRVQIFSNDPDEYINFEFYRLREGQWRFGIEIEFEELYDDNGNLINFKGKGYGRLMMAIIIYNLKNNDDLPVDLKLAGDHLTIGICADASDGFWQHMGMKMGKYSMDKDRYNSMTGPNCGYDREFTMGEWKRFVFKGDQKRASLKKKKTKRKKKRLSKSKKKLKRKRITQKKKYKNKIQRGGAGSEMAFVPKQVNQELGKKLNVRDKDGKQIFENGIYEITEEGARTESKNYPALNVVSDDLDEFPKNSYVRIIEETSRPPGAATPHGERADANWVYVNAFVPLDGADKSTWNPLLKNTTACEFKDVKGKVRPSKLKLAKSPHNFNLPKANLVKRNIGEIAKKNVGKIGGTLAAGSVGTGLGYLVGAEGSEEISAGIGALTGGVFGMITGSEYDNKKREVSQYRYPAPMPKRTAEMIRDGINFTPPFNQEDVPREIKFYEKRDPFYEFTNFWKHEWDDVPLVINGVEWPTTEHYYQSQKFAAIPQLVEMCRQFDEPRGAFDMSHDPIYTRYVRDDWHRGNPPVKDQVMYNALLHKFTKNQRLKDLLLSTGQSVLIEHTGNDNYWGDDGVANWKPGDKGNKLGQLLSRIRDEIRSGNLEGNGEGYAVPAPPPPPAQRQIQIFCPPGGFPGQSLRFQHEGRTYDTVVPPGVLPNAPFLVSIY
jgi:ribA/ribD-fused uncharacterized protein